MCTLVALDTCTAPCSSSSTRGGPGSEGEGLCEREGLCEEGRGCEGEGLCEREGLCEGKGPCEESGGVGGWC